MKRSEHDRVADLVVDAVTDAVSKITGVSVDGMMAHNRRVDLVYARHLVFYVCADVFFISLPKIGKRMGWRDHTTVLHGVRKMRSGLRHNAVIRDDIGILKCTLGHIVTKVKHLRHDHIGF